MQAFKAFAASNHGQPMLLVDPARSKHIFNMLIQVWDDGGWRDPKKGAIEILGAPKNTSNQQYGNIVPNELTI